MKPDKESTITTPQKKQIRPRRTYTTEFKQQIVDLYRSEKRKCDIIGEYDIASSLLDKWIAQTSERKSTFAHGK